MQKEINVEADGWVEFDHARHILMWNLMAKNAENMVEVYKIAKDHMKEILKAKKYRTGKCKGYANAIESACTEIMVDVVIYRFKAMCIRGCLKDNRHIVSWCYACKYVIDNKYKTCAMCPLIWGDDSVFHCLCTGSPYGDLRDYIQNGDVDTVRKKCEEVKSAKTTEWASKNIGKDFYDVLIKYQQKIHSDMGLHLTNYENSHVDIGDRRRNWHNAYILEKNRKDHRYKIIKEYRIENIVRNLVYMVPVNISM